MITFKTADMYKKPGALGFPNQNTTATLVFQFVHATRVTFHRKLYNYYE